MQTVKPRRVWITPATATALVVAPLCMGLIQYAQIACQRQTKVNTSASLRQGLSPTSRTAHGATARELIPVGHNPPTAVPVQTPEKQAALLRRGHILRLPVAPDAPQAQQNRGR